MSQKPKDLRGSKFNKLTPIRLAPKRNKHTEWVCQCDCGNEKVIRTVEIKNGSIKSCGCLSREINATKSKTHGETKTRLYKTWINIKERCYNPNNISYKYYGSTPKSVLAKKRIQKSTCIR